MLLPNVHQIQRGEFIMNKSVISSSMKICFETIKLSFRHDRSDKSCKASWDAFIIGVETPKTRKTPSPFDFLSHKLVTKPCNSYNPSNESCIDASQTPTLRQKYARKKQNCVSTPIKGGHWGLLEPKNRTKNYSKAKN